MRRRYSKYRFLGACVDTGAERSVIGLNQAKALCRESNLPLTITESPYMFKFGDHMAESMGSMEIRVPLRNGTFFRIRADMVRTDIPLLLGLDTMDEEAVIADNVEKKLISKMNQWSLPIVRMNGHMFVRWNWKEIMFTRPELQKLHLHFFHPNAKKLYNLLRRAKPEDCPPGTLRILEDIAKRCRTCLGNSPPPCRFRVSMPSEEVVFNEELSLDIMWLDVGRKRDVPVLHMVDTQTHYQNAILLKGESVRDVWDAFIEGWVTTYIGYPRRIKADQGSVFTSQLWHDLTTMTGINMELSGIESHNSNGVGERYHGPLRRVFSCVRDSAPTLDPEIALRCAVKGINDTVGPEGLVPSLLVYGVIPSMPSVLTNLPNQRERMEAITAARRQMETVTAELRVRKALKSKLPPATRFDVNPGNRVFVYREKKGAWSGPYKVVVRSSKEVFVELDGRKAHFNLSQVIPDTSEARNGEVKRLLAGMRQFMSNPPPRVFVTEVLRPSDERGKSPMFDAAKAKELEGLARRGVFEIVWREDLPIDANVLGGRFVLSIKNRDTNDEVYKARYVVQGHTDSEKNILVRNSTNLKQSSVRLLLSLAAVFGFRVWSQDVSQAYLQSAERLMRDVYVRPSKEFNLSSGQLLKFLKPLYGLADSGDYWHVTFAGDLRDDLMMVPSYTDLSLFFKVVKKKLAGMVGAYVDDSISAGTESFRVESKKTQRRFESKEREYDNFPFAGMQIESIPDGFKIHQREYALKLLPLPEDCTFSLFRSKRQELSWLVHTRPDIACAVNMLAQITEKGFGPEYVRRLNKVVKAARNHADRGIVQHRLDKESLSLKVYADAAFANNPDLRSQLGFIVLLSDRSGRCNTLHYSSCKARRVARSVLGAEVYALADGFDYVFSLKVDIERMLGKHIPLTILTDSKSLLDVIFKSSSTREKRLMIDIAMVREAFDREEVNNVGNVQSDQNPADALTKVGKCSALTSILESGKLNLKVDQWILRTPLRAESVTSEPQVLQKKESDCGNHDPLERDMNMS